MFDGLVEPVVLAAETWDSDATPQVDVADATEALAVAWTPRLRAALPVLRRVLHQLEEVERKAAASDARACAYCGGPVPAAAGKAKYCRRACRQRAYEVRKGRL